MKNNLIKENEKLKKEVIRLKKELLKTRIESDVKQENMERVIELKNLLSPKLDIQDISKTLFSFMYRIFPFNMSIIAIKKDNFDFVYQVFTKNGKIEFESTSKNNLFTNFLIDTIKRTKQPFFIEEMNKEIEIQKNFPNTKNTETCFAIPILNDENIAAVTYFESNKKGVYSEKEVKSADKLLKNVTHDFVKALTFTELSKNNYKDNLTGLYNKLYFIKTIEKEIEICRQKKFTFSVILSEITNFNQLINNLSSNTYNKILLELIKKLKKTTRGIDTLFRYDENKFLLLLPETNKFNIEILANKIKYSIEKKDIYKQNITLALGIYCYQNDNTETSETIINKVNLALNEAKLSKKNKITIFEEEKKDEKF